MTMRMTVIVMAMMGQRLGGVMMVGVVDAAHVKTPGNTQRWETHVPGYGIS
jgi:hypothetical protein